jgi:hypothetical protein
MSAINQALPRIEETDKSSLCIGTSFHLSDPLEGAFTDFQLLTKAY